MGFKDQLLEIQATTVDGNFLGPDGTAPPRQQIVKDLLARCLMWADIVLDR